MSITTFLALATLILAILSIALLWREWDRREKRVANLEKRIIELEANKNSRTPQRAADELLDAIAMLDLDIEKDEIEIERKRVIKAHVINALNVGTKREAK